MVRWIHGFHHPSFPVWILRGGEPPNVRDPCCAQDTLLDWMPVHILAGEKSASSNARLKSNKEIPGLVHQPRANMHISESQQEFFRMLDEKIEKGRDYCSEEEDVT
ncbi:uncharacterized protein C1orf21 homolog isoform X2 [Corvus hawaiiensis]|uniref:uncharacterized protein C1orf21 homolog isoform X2 n=1 Tax=Corvus hawaiiensis TaxID=134902 RepID=UPI002019D8B4|nr:uncharacterized protein C1orf21 homolog isoform X2 [Corvus hawaiiensis]